MSLISATNSSARYGNHQPPCSVLSRSWAVQRPSQASTTSSLFFSRNWVMQGSLQDSTTFTISAPFKFTPLIFPVGPTSPGCPNLEDADSLSEGPDVESIRQCALTIYKTRFGKASTDNVDPNSNPSFFFDCIFGACVISGCDEEFDRIEEALREPGRGYCSQATTTDSVSTASPQCPVPDKKNVLQKIYSFYLLYLVNHLFYIYIL